MNFSRALIALSGCFAALFSCAAQAVDGGMTPFHRGVELTQSGDLSVSNFDHRITDTHHRILWRKLPSS